MYATNTIQPTKQNQKPKNKSLRANRPQTKNKNNKTKVLGPTGHQSKNRKPKNQSLGVPGLIGPGTFVLLFQKPKPNFWFLFFQILGPWPDWPWSFFFWFLVFQKTKNIKKTKKPMVLSYFLTTNNKK